MIAIECAYDPQCARRNSDPGVTAEAPVHIAGDFFEFSSKVWLCDPLSSAG
jgi:hypothetical protein